MTNDFSAVGQQEKIVRLAISILSMDLTINYLHELDLPFDHNELFVTKVRNAIIDFRTCSNDLKVDYAILERLINEQFGENIGKILFAKVVVLYLGDHMIQPHHSAWDLVSSYWANPSARYLKHLPEAFVAWFRQEYNTTVAAEELEKKLKSSTCLPLSDWDLVMYQRHDFSPGWELSAYYYVYQFVRGVRLTKFLSKAEELLSEREVTAINQAAETTLQDLEVWMPEKIMGLKEFVRITNV